MDKVLDEMRQEAGCKRFGSVVGSRRRRLRLVRFHACWHLWRQKSLAEDRKRRRRWTISDATLWRTRTSKSTDAKVFGRDVLITAYLPNAFAKGRLKRFVEGGWVDGERDGFVDVGESSDDSERVDTFGKNEVLADVEKCCADEAQFDNDENDENGNDEICFYKSWDTYSALSTSARMRSTSTEKTGLRLNRTIKRKNSTIRNRKVQK